MFAVVEFMNSDNESAGEISVVPVSWLRKNDAKCYWPTTTKRRSFSDFVKDETPYKTSWPCYKVFKVHLKTASYENAEKMIEQLTNTACDSSSSLISNKSIIRKVANKLDISCSSESPSPVGPVKITTKKRLFSSTLSSDDECTEKESSTRKENISLHGVPSNAPTPLQSPSHLSETDNLSVSITDDVNCSSEKGMEEVARHLSFIKNMLVQHSIILNSLQNHAQLTNTGSLVPPPDLPDFPIKTFESFTEFEKMIDESEAVRTYMTQRLAAVGGSGVDGLVRRILKFLISNDVAMLFNWKGREKRFFQNTLIMKII